MKTMKKMAAAIAVMAFVLAGFATDALAQNGKVHNDVGCAATVIVWITDGVNFVSFGPQVTPPNLYYTVPAGWSVYKINIDGVTLPPPPVGACTPIVHPCISQVCTDSPFVFVLQ